MYTIHHDDLKILLETVNPASVLLLDPHPMGLPAAGDREITQVADDVLNRLQTLGHFDLGIVANTLEHLDHKTAAIVLARLRDLHTRRFVALAPIGPSWTEHRSQWERTDLLAFGMTLMARYQLDGKPLHLYHYAIESYKTTPEWFNSRDWAHPERWRP